MLQNTFDDKLSLVKVINWANADPYLFHNVVSLGHIELMHDNVRCVDSVLLRTAKTPFLPQS